MSKRQVIELEQLRDLERLVRRACDFGIGTAAHQWSHHIDEIVKWVENHPPAEEERARD